MSRYIVKRLLYLIPMLFCVVLLIFLIMALTPGDPASNVLPLTTPKEVKDAFNEKVGFSGSLWSRFWGYMKGLVTGNVMSYTTQENVFKELGSRFPLTIRLGLIAFSIAIMILPFKKKTQSLFKSVYYLPGIASGVALSVVWLWLYDSSPDGLFNQVLMFFGIPSQNWLSSSKTSMLSLMLMAILSGQGSNIIIYIAALLGIDNSYFEAAELDGATFFQKVRYIVFPLVKPTTLFLLVTGIIGSFQVFQNAFMMTGGGPDNSTTMIGLLIYKNAFEYSKFGLACAQAILLAIVIAL